MKQRLKQLLDSTFPVWSLTLQSIRSRRLVERQCKALGLTQTAQELAKFSKNRVVNGIFEGMVLHPEIFPQHLAPKYLGTYENELNYFLYWCIVQAPDVIINVGCAEGYYAVGLARHLPDTPIFAFDADPKARRATRAHADLNEVQNVNVRGPITPGDLGKFLNDFAKPLVILDCEGCEKELICFRKINNLAKSYLLIELHPNVYPNIQQSLELELSRAYRTQVILPIRDKPIPENCEEYCAGLHPDALSFLTDERRGLSNRWICAIPRSIASPPF